MVRRRSDQIIRTAEFVTIGELVRITGQRYSTLKYYTEEGLLPFTQDDTGLTRRYRRRESVERLIEIQTLKQQGLTLSEIKENILSMQSKNPAGL